MQVKTIPAGRSIEWFKQGWAIFSQDMKTWTLMALLFGVVAIVLNLVPFIGALALLIIMPALTGGMLYTAQEAAHGHAIRVDYLWTVLRDAKKRPQFLLLGAIFLAAFFLFALLSAGMISDAAMKDPYVGMRGIGVGSGVFMLFFGFLSFVLLNYSVALMLFENMTALNALQKAAAQGVTYIVPLLVFFILYGIAGAIASIPFGLGLLVLIPVTMGAIYVSYQELFA